MTNTQLKLTAACDQARAAVREHLAQFNMEQLCVLVDSHLREPLSVTLAALANHSSTLSLMAGVLLIEEMERRTSEEGA